MTQISRRQILAGTAGVTLAAGAGVVAWKPRGVERLANRIGVLSSPDRTFDVSARTVTEETFNSVAMGSTTKFALSAPLDTPTAVVICLHGASTNRRFAFDDLHLHDACAQFGDQYVLAAPDGGSNYWHRRTDGKDYQAMIVTELLPELRARFGELPTAVWGWSMGGYGAILTAEKHPGIFKAAVASSPALFDHYEAAMSQFDSEADFTENNVFDGLAALDGCGVRIDCGESDVFAQMSTRLLDALGDRATGEISEGFHDSQYWRSRIEVQSDAIRPLLQPVR